MKILRKIEINGDTFVITAVSHAMPFETMPDSLVVEQIAEDGEVIYRKQFEDERKAKTAFLYRVIQWEACFIDDGEEVDFVEVVTQITALHDDDREYSSRQSCAALLAALY